MIFATPEVHDLILTVAETRGQATFSRYTIKYEGNNTVTIRIITGEATYAEIATVVQHGVVYWIFATYYDGIEVSYLLVPDIRSKGNPSAIFDDRFKPDHLYVRAMCSYNLGGVEQSPIGYMTMLAYVSATF